MATVGYARVSSVGQSLDVQIEKLQHCDKVFQEKRSGLNAGRPALRRCLEFLREGDTLLVTKIDRLGIRRQVSVSTSPASSSPRMRAILRACTSAEQKLGMSTTL